MARGIDHTRQIPRIGAALDTRTNGALWNHTHDTLIGGTVTATGIDLADQGDVGQTVEQAHRERVGALRAFHHDVTES